MVVQQLNDLLYVYISRDSFWEIANISGFHITNLRLLYILPKGVWIKESEFRIIRNFIVSLETIEILTVFVAIFSKLLSCIYFQLTLIIPKLQ